MHRRWTMCFAILFGWLAFWSGNSHDVVLGAGQGSAQTGSAGGLAITHGRYLQLPTSTSMTIVWHTNKKCVSKVEYGTGDELGMRWRSSG